MSKPVRIALVSEGVTDYVVLQAAVAALLGSQPFELKLLQPEESVAFVGSGDAGPLGGGWRGVYKWCLQTVARSALLRHDILFDTYDLLLLHLDADVADEDPANDRVPIPELDGVLPCAQPCPEPASTTNALRQILLGWLAESEVPPRTVLCTPSKSIEAWMVAIFIPNDKEMARQGWECYAKPHVRLGQLPKKKRFAKTVEDYQQRSAAIQQEWPSVVERLSEAKRFQDDFAHAVAPFIPPTPSTGEA